MATEDREPQEVPVLWAQAQKDMMIDQIEQLQPEEVYVFVFGSNLNGWHGAGAAREARELYGAKWGQGIGPQGSSYAIPTKGRLLNTLPLEIIQIHIDYFLVYAKEHPDVMFFVTRVGCGLAGYKDEEIAPMFKNAPDNVQFQEPSWRQIP